VASSIRDGYEHDIHLPDDSPNIFDIVVITDLPVLVHCLLIDDTRKDG
jgi:hypothetical protein